MSPRQGKMLKLLTFQGKTYPKLLSKLQNNDKYSAFASSSVNKKYADNEEPKTLAGRNKVSIQ
jgi:hypothetical protein